MSEGTRTVPDEIFEEAPREIKGYVDITIDTLKRIHEIAHRHARGSPSQPSVPVLRSKAVDSERR